MRASLIESTTLSIDDRASVRDAILASAIGGGLDPSASPLASGPLDALSADPKALTSHPDGIGDGFQEVIPWATGFLAVWNRSDTNAGTTGVYGQKFDASGNAVGGLITIEAPANNVGGKPELVDVGGGKVAVFYQYAGTMKGVFLAPDTGALSGAKTIFNQPADWMKDVVRLANGDIAMVTSQYDGPNADINLVIINDANLATVATRTVDTFGAPSNTYDHTVTKLGTGGVMVYRDRDNNQLYGQRFNANGGFIDAPQKLNSTPINVPTFYDVTNYRPQAVELSTGGYVATWVNVEGSGGDRIDVRARVFDAAGASVGKDFIVNGVVAGNQYDPQVVALDGGRFAVLWVNDFQSSHQTMIRYFDSGGHALTDNILVGSPSIFSGNDHQLTILADGTIADVYGDNPWQALFVDGVAQPTFGSDAADALNGTANNDVIIAGGGNDTINVKQGGNDVVSGGAGADVIDFGASYNTADTVDGGAGIDTVKLNGDYGGLPFQGNFTNVEAILLGAGHDYGITLNNNMVAPGASLKIDGSALGATDNLLLFGSGESDGRLTVLGGAGADQLYDGGSNDVIHAGAGNDVIGIGSSGNDTVRGEGGNDTIEAAGSLNDRDAIDGGAGVDLLKLSGNTYASGLVFKSTTVVGIEKIGLGAGYSYNLTLNNANVALGQTLTIDGSALGSSNSLRVDGSAETNGHLVLTGGAGADVLIGGHGSDRLAGGAGDDILDLSAGGLDIAGGGAGTDSFRGGAGFDVRMRLDGGDGSDTLILNGDYVLRFQSTTLKGVESLELQGAHDYSLTMDTANVAAGQSLSVLAFALGQANSLVFDGRAEVNGAFNVMGGSGDDTIRGGAGNDTLTAGNATTDYSGVYKPAYGDVVDLSRGGVDYASGYGGVTFLMGGALTADDRLQGGGNPWDYCLAVLDGNYATRVTMNGLTMSMIDEVRLTKGHDYNLDVYVGNQQVVTVDGSSLTTADQMNVSLGGSTITKGVLIGGAASDTLTGSREHDSIVGGGGADRIDGGDRGDTLTGGAGADTFVFNYVSYGGEADTVTDLTNADKLDVSFVDANANVDGNQKFKLIGDADFSGHAGEMQVKFFGTDTFVQADTNGDGSADMVMFLLSGDHTGFSNFVL
jgi:Ca2+-binding RTX toxin-like protein